MQQKETRGRVLQVRTRALVREATKQSTVDSELLRTTGKGTQQRVCRKSCTNLPWRRLDLVPSHPRQLLLDLDGPVLLSRFPRTHGDDEDGVAIMVATMTMGRR